MESGYYYEEELNITPKIAEYEEILRMDFILGGWERE